MSDGKKERSDYFKAFRAFIEEMRTLRGHGLSFGACNTMRKTAYGYHAQSPEGQRTRQRWLARKERRALESETGDLNRTGRANGFSGFEVKRL